MTTTHLRRSNFSEKWSALNLNEPSVLDGIASEGPFDFAEHCVSAELEACQK